MEPPRLVVSVINGGTIKTRTVGCLFNLVGSMPFYLLMPTSGYPVINREMSVDMARKQRASHLMFIDADMIFTPADVNRLLGAQKTIIGANYHLRTTGKNATMIYGDGRVIRQIEDKELPTEPFQCAAVGSGFMLCDMETFTLMKPPYFNTRWHNGGFQTEDTVFCLKAHSDAGIRVWCDPTLKIGHIGETVV